MERIFLDTKAMNRIVGERAKIESALDIQIKIGRTFVDISGEGLSEYTSLQVLKAIEFGFDVQTSLLLKDEEYIMQTIPIKNYIGKSSKRLSQVKARVIGRQGGAIKNISLLGNCAIRLSGSIVLVIGRAEEIEGVLDSLISLIKGSEHGNVYSRLERAGCEIRDSSK
ncbi:MAG: hypothetical protein V1886_00230 [archaeon]